MCMKMSKKQKLNDVEIYSDLLLMITEVENIQEVNIIKTPTIKIALERLMLGVQYTMLDLEATRREREYLKKLLEDNGKT